MTNQLPSKLEWKNDEIKRECLTPYMKEEYVKPFEPESKPVGLFGGFKAFVRNVVNTSLTGATVSYDQNTGRLAVSLHMKR